LNTKFLKRNNVVPMVRPQKDELIQFGCHYTKDTDFASHARLLQGKWRVKKNYPENITPRSNYGNFIETDFAKREKINFLTDNIKKLVSQKIIEINRNGGLIGEPRIWNNLLSSQPLCFNLFGELHYDLQLATQYFRKLFSNLITQDTNVTKVEFEYSSRRRQPDSSAFDVFVEYSRGGIRGFLGIEVKYQESLTEEKAPDAKRIFESHKEDYIRLTEQSKFFKPGAIEKLQLVPLSQIWRDHLLSYNMGRDYDESCFVFLYPFQNDECARAIVEYKKLLQSDDELQSRFYPRDLTEFILTLNKLHDTEWSRELISRYIG